MFKKLGVKMKGKNKKDKMKNRKKTTIENTGNDKAENTEVKDENNSQIDSSQTDDLAAENEKLKQEIAELKDSLLRRLAEFENYKKRTEVYQSELLKYAAQDFILEILQVYNDFERSLTHVEEAKDIDAIKSGMKLVFDKFTKALNSQGVTKMETKGKEFDVNLHDALLQQPTNEVEPDKVLSEVEPGYMYKDKVLKHAKVIVSKELEEEPKTETEKED